MSSTNDIRFLTGIQPGDFRVGDTLRVTDSSLARSQSFIVASIGGIHYAVNINTGRAMTRPQLMTYFSDRAVFTVENGGH